MFSGRQQLFQRLETREIRGPQRAALDFGPHTTRFEGHVPSSELDYSGKKRDRGDAVEEQGDGAMKTAGREPALPGETGPDKDVGTEASKEEKTVETAKQAETRRSQNATVSGEEDTDRKCSPEEKTVQKNWSAP